MPRQRLQGTSATEIHFGDAVAEIEGADDAFIAFLAREDDDISLPLHELDVAFCQRRMGAAEGKEAAVMLKQRSAVTFLDVDRLRQMFARHRQPRLGARETAIG